jgi:ABC-2 type transport system permease protein
VSAAATLTFRRGTNAVALGALLLALGSGLYFPVDLLPQWVVTAAELNPIALAVDGMRSALLGGAGWSEIGPIVAKLAPLSALSLVIGLGAFRLALRREQRLGTLGLY